MTIKQALKEKNKLVVEIANLYNIAKTYNSIEEGNVRRYSVENSLTNIQDLIDKLVELKTKIHKANAPVYNKIFLMSELKTFAKQLKGISCEEGKVIERYGSVASVKNVEINVKQRDLMLKNIESKIESLQDDLDYHNATTSID